MVYSFELIKHANIRYRESLPALARCELFAMLFSLGISCDISLESNIKYNVIDIIDAAW